MFLLDREADMGLCENRTWTLKIGGGGGGGGGGGPCVPLLDATQKGYRQQTDMTMNFIREPPHQWLGDMNQDRPNFDQRVPIGSVHPGIRKVRKAKVKTQRNQPESSLASALRLGAFMSHDGGRCSFGFWYFPLRKSKGFFRQTKRPEFYLDCYWVGSLDFNFLGNKGVFHKTPKRLNFLQGGQEQPSYKGVISSRCELDSHVFKIDS